MKSATLKFITGDGVETEDKILFPKGKELLELSGDFFINIYKSPVRLYPGYTLTLKFEGEKSISDQNKLKKLLIDCINSHKYQLTVADLNFNGVETQIIINWKNSVFGEILN